MCARVRTCTGVAVIVLQQRPGVAAGRQAPSTQIHSRACSLQSIKPSVLEGCCRQLVILFGPKTCNCRAAHVRGRNSSLLSSASCSYGLWFGAVCVAPLHACSGCAAFCGCTTGAWQALCSVSCSAPCWLAWRGARPLPRPCVPRARGLGRLSCATPPHADAWASTMVMYLSDALKQW